MHLTPEGRLIGVVNTAEGLTVSESRGGGRSWEEFRPMGIPASAGGITKLNLGPQAFLNLRDGSMLLFCYGKHVTDNPEMALYSWGSCHRRALAFRSTDDGRNWSGPIKLDFAGPLRDGGRYEGNLDITEASAAQVTDGRVVALFRTTHSPWMWENWSSDGGATWGPCVRGPFPGYAASNMLRTTSGALLVAHRLPLLAAHVSFDDGHTWDQGTVIDGAHWAMGQMVEVEPDVALYVYWDSFESLMRAQFISVTPSGLEPMAR